eukprot:PhF_6_TR1024/c0_g1_i1/m.2063/K01692/paaF, echA; enoyl-CoA hydratase
MYKNIIVEACGNITKIGLNRPHRRNAIDTLTATELVKAFTDFDNNPEQRVAVLYGTGGTFCAGADLHAVSTGALTATTSCPLGATGLTLSKPVVGAIQGFAVAGGLELALWCDMRVAEPTTTFGVFCRRFGVPLIDGGTIRLPRTIGHGRAMHMILTGCEIKGTQALDWGLCTVLVDPSANPNQNALTEAMKIAEKLAAFPQRAMLGDRMSAIKQWGLSLGDALQGEFAYGIPALTSAESVQGATRFTQGQGRHGT